MVEVYIGLARADNSEPSAAAGYSRIYLGQIEESNLDNLMTTATIAFEQAKAPGFGEIAYICLFNQNEILKAWKLPEPVNVHEGVTPALFNGHLIRGIEVQAEVILNSSDLCDPRGV